MKRYRIELLQTAEGVNLKRDKTKDTIIIFLWAENQIEAERLANKIAKALDVPTYVGMLEYVVKSVLVVPGGLSEKEERMLKKSKRDVRKGRVSRVV